MRGWLGRRSRVYKGLAALGSMFGLVLAFVPLFNLIGYESAAFFGVFYGFTVAYLGFEDLSIRGWFTAVLTRLALLVVPFLILTANALFVRNCAFLTGVEFWLLIPVFSIAIATTVGWLVRKLEGERRWVGNGLIAAVSLLTVADFGLRLALEPPIIGFHWFLGYFSGSIYDEALNLPAGLVAYRVMHALGIATVLSAHEALRTRQRKLAALSVVLAASTIWGFAVRRDYGIDVDRGRIIDKLGAVVESEHFIIHYPAVPPFTDDVQRLVEDHEFRYAEMKAYFGTDPVELRGEKVRSFVYANMDQKGALMGARRTLVAKIWLREIHILWRRFGDHMLAHELAHVFTEPFGTGPLRLSSRAWVLTNMGLVEGVATAADWDGGAMDPHRASAALRRLGKAPDIVGLVGASGFWTQSSGRAYTLMGSFTQWLVDEHGMEKFRDAYGHGEFERVYQRSTAELVSDWGTFVDAIELTEAELELAQYYYDRKSIFQKVCARTIGDLRIRASARARAKDRKAAIELMLQILAFDPENVDYRIEYAETLLALGDDQASMEILRKLASEELDASQRPRVLALMGDGLWRTDDRAAAAASYEQCLSAALPVDAQRLLIAKSLALREGADAEFAFSYFLDSSIANDVRLFFPAEWARRNPEQPLAHYLVGRRLWNARQWTWAEPYLRKALLVPAGPLLDETKLMLGQTLHFLGRAREAEQQLRAWQPSSTPYIAAREEWLRRVAWKSRNRVDGQAR